MASDEGQVTTTVSRPTGAVVEKATTGDDAFFHDVALDDVAARDDDVTEGVGEAVRGRKMAFKKLSVIHLVSGIVSIALASSVVVVRNGDVTYYAYDFTKLAPGIWCGLVYSACAVSTRFVAVKKMAGMVTIAWGVAACATACGCAMMCLDLSTCIILLSDKNCCQNSKTALVIIHLVSSAIACLQIVVSTITCGFCCRVYCCLSEQQELHYKAAVYSIFSSSQHRRKRFDNEMTTTRRVTTEAPTRDRNAPITSTSSFDLPRSP